MTRRRRSSLVKVKPVIVDQHAFATPNEAARYVAIRDRALEIRHMGNGQGLSVFEYRFEPNARWEREAFRQPAQARNKFGAKATVVDGIRFDSKGEAKRYTVLKAKLDAGQIRQLTLQQPFELVIRGVKIGRYVADFTYYEGDRNDWIVEDFKGYRTPEYRMKAKLMQALHGIHIREVS